ncbi:MAG: carboxypeptidase M32 [Xanthobacteraceae bacterium]
MLGELKQRLREISDLTAAADVLSWDQATYMPEGGAGARGGQRAMLCRLAHERSIAPALGRLIDALTHHGESLAYDSDDASLIRAAHREYQKKIKIPPDHVARATAHSSASYDAWTRARPANGFAAMVPYLERTLDLSREYSSYFVPNKNIADPHIDDADEGMTTASTRKLFGELKRQLVPMVRAICEQPAADDSSLRQTFAKATQFDFALHAAESLGYDLKRGRLDLTHHPFCTRFSAGDVRITTRVNENDLGDALFSTLHEAGHALYEQGVAAALDGTPLGRGVSAGVHESQSRLWENVVGRSRGFWEHFYPSLQRTFAEQLSSVPLDSFYCAINKVARSLIRTDADEVTYNLHIMLRFDLEIKLLEGKLRVTDLPEAWHGAMQADLGTAPPNDRDGCLQDAHWYSSYIGGQFQSYTIGNILSAQFYAAALRAHPDIPHEISSGQFATLHSWLRENLYRHGSKFVPNALVERATGAAISMGPYLDYLREKYGALYGLPANASGGGRSFTI